MFFVPIVPKHYSIIDCIKRPTNIGSFNFGYVKQIDKYFIYFVFLDVTSLYITIYLTH